MLFPKVHVHVDIRLPPPFPPYLPLPWIFAYPPFPPYIPQNQCTCVDFYRYNPSRWPLLLHNITVLLMNFCRLSLVVWSHMTMAWCQLLSPAYLISSCFAEVMHVLHSHAYWYKNDHPYLQNASSLFSAQDATFLLNKLFSLATRSSHNCASELFRALEACTQYTHR